MGQRPDICLLVNPGAGSDDTAAKLARLEAACARHAGRFERRTLRRDTPVPEQVREAARDGFARIGAAGGDGTAAGVAAGIAALGAPAPAMAVVPLGTFNYFARGLGLPLEAEAAVDLAAEGVAQPVSTGEVNGQIFLNNASLGLYPEVLRRRERIYARFGRSRPAAIWSVARTLMRAGGPEELRLALDGGKLRRRSPLAFVARSAFQIERFGLSGADCVRSGRFAVFFAPDKGRAWLAFHAARLGLGRAEPGRDFDWRCASEAVIETRAPRRRVACDGERRTMEGPFHFRIRADALHVVVPEATPQTGAPR
jgi:diacylglycerol kinase family enzyme